MIPKRRGYPTLELPELPDHTKAAPGASMSITHPWAHAASLCMPPANHIAVISMDRNRQRHAFAPGRRERRSAQSRGEIVLRDNRFNFTDLTSA